MRNLYLLFISISVFSFGAWFTNPDNKNDSTSYDFKKKEVLKKPTPPKKYRPLVLKPEKIADKNTENLTQTWLDEAMFAPTITAVKTADVSSVAPGGTINYSVVLSNTASVGGGNDATSIVFNDILNNNLTLVAGSVKVTPIIVDDSYNCIGNVGITVPAASGLLANDISPDNKPLQATATNTAGTQGTVVANPDGSFTFTPTAGYSGTTTFTYTVSNGDFARTATVSIVVSAPIWFVNIGATSSTNVGTLANPFKDWSDFATANALTGANNPAANQTIFVYSGTYSGAATLKSGQKVLGQGATTTLASFASITVPTFSSPALPTTSGTKPNLTSSGTSITLGSGNTLRGFDMGNSTTDITGSSFGTLTISEMALNGDGRALNLQSGTLATTFTSISSTNSTAEGIVLSSVSGTLTSSGGTTITNPTSSGIGVTGASSVNANFGNTNISGSGSAGLVVIGTTNNTASLTFGDLDIAPDATKEAINYFARGSITCTSGTITSSNTPGTIGGIFIEGANSTNKVTLNMVLNSFTHSGSQLGLILINTLGSFTINGTGTAGSGGTIQNTSSYGVNLNNASGISLNYMNITNTGKSCISATNLSGTCAINNSTLSMGSSSLSATGYDRRCVHILNQDVAMTLNVNGSTFNGQLTNSPDNNYGIAYETTNAATSSTVGTLNIKTSVFNNFANYAVYTTSTGAAITDVGIQTSSVDFDNTNANTTVGGAFHIYNLRSAKTTFNVINNTSLITKGPLPIEFYTNNFDGSEFTPASGRTMEGKFNNNILTRHSTDGGTSVYILVKGKSNAVVEVNGNTITKGNLTVQTAENTPSAANETARLDATVTNNTIEQLVDNNGIDVSSGNGNTPVDVNGNGTFSNVINCVKISGNNITPLFVGSTIGGLIRFRTEGVTGGNASRIWREGVNGTGETSSVTYWNANNNLANGVANAGVSSTGNLRVRDSGFGILEFKAAGTCLTPANAAPARIAAPEYVKNQVELKDSTFATNAISEEIQTEEAVATIEEDKPVNVAVSSISRTENSSAKMMAGETVTVNGAGSGFSLPAGKSTTIIFSATVSATPSTCAITNQASISGSNFTTVNSNTTTTNLIVPTINAGSTISATSVCPGGSVTVSATCPSGSQLNWFTAPSGGGSVSTSSPYSPTNITAATSYYASCTIGGCESARTLVGSVTINPLPTITVSASPAICEGATSFTIPYTGTTGTPTTYSISGTGIAPVTNVALPATPITVNISDVGGATGSSYAYTLTVKNANGCTSSNITGNVIVNSTSAPTSPTATPSNFTVSGTTTLTATGCNSPSTITWYDSSNPTVALPNNTPTISANKTFFAKCTGTNTCVSNASTNVSVTYNPCVPLSTSPGNVGIHWTGLISTDWNNPCNWNPAWVPDATNSAVVIDLKTNQPTITGTVPTVNLIYINANAILTVSSGGTLNSNSTVAAITLQGGNIVNDGTINVSGGGSGIGINIGAMASITNRGTITTNNLLGILLDFGNLTFTNESTGILNGDIRTKSNILTLTNRGTINYTSGSTFALNLNSGSSVINDGTINISAGSGISNPSGSTITNNTCGKILMSVGEYQNGGTTTNAGLIQMPTTYSFINTGTFTNNGVLKANAVSGITNNKMVVTNACPIFILGGSNNYTVSGIFTDAGVSTSAGTYTSAGNKFTANNTIPIGTQTLYAQVTDGTCTFTVPFDFTNAKPMDVSISTTNICVGSNVILSATCASGTVTWYGSGAATSPLGTGATFSYVPSAGTGQAFYAACEETNCVSGRTITSNFVNVNPIPSAPSVTLTSPATVCQPATLNLTATGCTGTITWSDNSTGTSLIISAAGTYNVSATCTANGCTSPISTGNTGLVINAPISANPSSDSPKCVGTTLTFNSAAGMASYTWSGPNSFTSSIQAPSISNVTSAAAGTYTLTVTNGACTSSATTAVLINQSATATPSPSTQTICSAGPITTIAITGTGSSYSWTRDNTTTVTGIAASGSGDISGSLTNTTEAPITVTFTITPMSTCSGTTTTATVVVNPIPTATASTPSQSICSGSAITGITFNSPPTNQPAVNDPSSDIVPTITPKSIQGVAFSSAVVGTVFNWTRDNTATVTGIAASGTGNISGILINNTASPITVTFTVTPSYTNAGTTCTGTPITVTVTVNPNSSAPIITGGDVTICTGSPTTLSASTGYSSYTWQRRLATETFSNVGTGETQAISKSGFYQVIGTNSYGCNSTSGAKYVTVSGFEFSGTLANGDAQQTGRINRFAQVSTCSSPKGCPLTFTTSGLRLYDSYNVTNTSNSSVCATVGIESGCGTAIFAVAYLGSYNPSNLCQNYLGDGGSSFVTRGFFEVTIPANQTIVLVVHEVNPGSGCANYKLNVDLGNEAPAITVSPNTPIECGASVTLTASRADSYLWNVGGSTSQSITVNPTNTTDYSVTLGYGNGTCTATATTTVTVNSITPPNPTNDSPKCVGTTLSFNSVAGMSGYEWKGPNSFSSASRTPIISNVTTAANGVYTLTVTNSSGCSASATTNVTINALPVPNPTSDSPKCVGTTLTFNSVAGMTAYAWTGPNSFTGNTQTPSISNVTTAAQGIYTLTVTNANGCSASATTAVTINPLPIPNPSSDSPKCVGTTLTFNSVAGMTNYTWSGPNSFTSSIQAPSIINVSTAANGTYTLTVTNASGCSASATTAVTINQILPPTITPPTSLSVCSPSTLTLTASGCAGIVTWSQGGATGASLTLSTIGTYSISATCTVNGCTSDASTAVTGLEIKAKPNAPTITPPTSLSVCSPSTLTLTASGCAGIVTWSQSGATGTSLTLSTIGTYSVSATCTVNGCTSDASTEVNGLEIKAKPNAPTITPPTSLSVCSPSTLTLTASGCAGIVTWSQGGATGASLTLSTIGTYSVSATCTVNGCTSDASTEVNGLEIKAKPNAPTITPPTSLSVCSPSTLTLAASGCTGIVTWSQSGATGTSLTLSTVGTYSISATCTVNACTSDASTAVTGLEIKAKPNAPTITPPTSLSVCSPSTLTLTASGCAGIVTWSQGGATGASLTLSTIGTYSISATCTVNGCTSDASTAVNGLEIKAKPNAPTITPPTSLSVCSPSTLTLTASGCAGIVTWSQGAATGASLTLSTVGTYSVSATCTVNACTSDASTAVNGLEIKATPIITATNTGPYTVGQTINLTGTGAVSYNWTGPNNFSSSLSTPSIPNALSVNGGIYTLSVTAVNGCNAVATTNVIVSGIDPCDPSRIVDYTYVKAGNPYQTLFPLTNGMIINQRTDQVSILVNPVCASVAIESFEMNLQGPEMNWNILQNVSPYALFDNLGLDVWGRNLKPGVYTLTVTGYPQDNKGGVATYGPKVITFTIVGDLATINAPTLSKTAICAGNNVDVSFTTTGSFNGVNQFQVELSDSSGSFAAPVLIGTTNTTGTLNCTIPQSTLEGSKYLIRVTSTNQVVVSNPAMSLVTIHPFTYNLVSPTNNLTGTSTKKAVTTINASNKVTSPASVTYQAGNSILLTPGFESGAVFKAEIQGCNN